MKIMQSQDINTKLQPQHPKANTFNVFDILICLI